MPPIWTISDAISIILLTIQILRLSVSTAVFGTAEAVLRNNAYTVDAQVGLKMAF